MVILGLGANLGDRLTQFRQAIMLLKQIPEINVGPISPLYMSDALLPANADPEWNTPYLNLAVRCETTLTPLDFLAKIKKIEEKVGRIPGKEWGPRIIDIDILAWDELIQYDHLLHIPHEQLTSRPFALWPLADLAPFWIHPVLGKTALELSEPWGSRFDGNAPLHTQQIQHRIDTPSLVGIVNLTPDSFSDGYLGQQDDVLINFIQQLVRDGAEVIDLGAESTRPQAKFISPQEEWQRLEPILSRVMHTSFLIPPKISIDTRHPETAEKALSMGVDWINDVTGLENPRMQQWVTGSRANFVFMHHLDIPASTKTLPLNRPFLEIIYRWAEKKLQDLLKLGVNPDRLIFDIGIGFGKNKEQSLSLIKNISLFKKLGIKLLCGHSRKSFLTQFTNHPANQRDNETIAISTFLMQKEIDYLRVHTVYDHSQSFKILQSLS